jgi:hypothetical protein
MTEGDLVVVATFSNRIEAEAARTALEAAGIEAFVRSDDAGGVQPGLWRSNPVELIVREEDAEQAHDILEREAKQSPS